MANEVKNEENLSVIAAYTIYRMSNGNTTVENAEVEGVQKLSTSQIFADIRTVARQIEKKEQADMIRAEVIGALSDYLRAAQNQEKAEEVEAAIDGKAVAAEPQVEMPE